METKEQHLQAHDDSSIELDDQGWMTGRDVSTVLSDQSQALWPGETHILGIVWHYTDTRSVGALRLAQRIAHSGVARAASWHVCIDRAGQTVQSVSMLRGSWHAGGATAARFAVAGMERGHRMWSMSSPTNRGQPGANSLFTGIELENVGELRRVDKEWLGWPFRRGLPVGEPIIVPEDEVHIEGNGRGHHLFTVAQHQAAQRVTSALVNKYDLIWDNCAFSHAQIDPQNRTDPGPVWMGIHLPEILFAVFGSK
jgi:N-acetyl-anhydromuramyl-L-alanine amidase AmpD